MEQVRVVLYPQECPVKRPIALVTAALTLSAAMTNVAVADQPSQPSQPSQPTSPAAHAAAKPPAVTAMTRNIYLGVDVTRPP